MLAAKRSGDWVALQGLGFLTMLVARAGRGVLPAADCVHQPPGRPDHRRHGLILVKLWLWYLVPDPHHRQPDTLRVYRRLAQLVHAEKSTFGVDKSVDWGFFGNLPEYEITWPPYVCILLFIILSVICTRPVRPASAGLRRESPGGADSLINVYKMRYTGITISALAGMGGAHAMTTAAAPPTATWQASASGSGRYDLRQLEASEHRGRPSLPVQPVQVHHFPAYTSVDINGDGVFLAGSASAPHLYLPDAAVPDALLVLALPPRVPGFRSRGIPYDKGRRGRTYILQYPIFTKYRRRPWQFQHLLREESAVLRVTVIT